MFSIMIFLTFGFSVVSMLISLLTLLIALNHYQSKRQEHEDKSSQAILISGCDTGIGLELAKYFYRTTKFKIICGFLRPSDSDGYKDLEKLDDNNRLILKKLDITSDGDINSIVDTISELTRGNQIEELFALINNAGVMAYGEFDWLTWDQIQKQIDVNFVGSLKLTRSLIPFIIASKGRIINVSSVNDITVFPGTSVYSATKSALSTFSKGLGYELRKFGAHVVTMRLGDFARLTSIMNDHAKHRDDMWAGMNSKKQQLYSGSFHQFNDHLIRNYGMTSPKEFADSSLFTDFRQALLSRDPPSTMMSAPLKFKVFYFVIELLPIWLQYNLLDLLIRFGFNYKSTPAQK